MLLILLLDDVVESGPELYPLHEDDEGDNVEYVVGDLEVDLYIYQVEILPRRQTFIGHLQHGQHEADYTLLIF